MIKVYVKNSKTSDSDKTNVKEIELPIDEEDLEMEIRELTNNFKDGYVITDSEAPFDIDEHDRITTINKLANYLEENKYDVDLEDIQLDIKNHEYENAIYKIKKIGHYLDSLGETYALELCNQYIDEDYATELAKHELEQHGIGRLYTFLGDVNFNSESVYRLDSHGNLNSITKEDIEILYEDVVECLKEYVKTN